MNKLNENYKNVKLLQTQEWPLPMEISKNTNLLNDLQNEDKINIKTKFGMKIFETSIYIAYN